MLIKKISDIKRWKKTDSYLYLLIRIYFSFSEISNIKTILEKCLLTLSEREAKLLLLRSGLYDGNKHSLREISNIWHLTTERIRQIEAKALRKLKHIFRKTRLKEILQTSIEENIEVFKLEMRIEKIKKILRNNVYRLKKQKAGLISGYKRSGDKIKEQNLLKEIIIKDKFLGFFEEIMSEIEEKDSQIEKLRDAKLDEYLSDKN